MHAKIGFPFFFFLGILTGTNVLAQVKLELPESIELKTPEDYTKYEALMITAADWLVETDLSKEQVKRKAVTTFVIQWLTGSSKVGVEISEPLSAIYGENVQLLGIYLACYAKSILEGNGKTSKFKATRDALIAMMKVYKKGVDIKESKEMLQVIKATDNNELDNYIRDDLFFCR